jgi:hypothetical protein
LCISDWPQKGIDLTVTQWNRLIASHFKTFLFQLYTALLMICLIGENVEEIERSSENTSVLLKKVVN